MSVSTELTAFEQAEEFVRCSGAVTLIGLRPDYVPTAEEKDLLLTYAARVSSAALWLVVDIGLIERRTLREKYGQGDAYDERVSALYDELSRRHPDVRSSITWRQYLNVGEAVSFRLRTERYSPRSYVSLLDYPPDVLSEMAAKMQDGMSKSDVLSEFVSVDDARASSTETIIAANGNRAQKNDRWGNAPLKTNELGSYRVEEDGTKRCEKCQRLWAAPLDYCPYCHLSPEVRAYHAALDSGDTVPFASPLMYQEEEKETGISFSPDYDGDEWFTPQEYIEAAREVLGEIDLDPATCPNAQEIVQAKTYYTKQDDALRDEIVWCGRVWLNPPYSKTLIEGFVEKLIGQHESGLVTEAIILTNNSTDTGWFHSLLSRYPMCLTRGRIPFWRPGLEVFATRQGQAFFYLGSNLERFEAVFSRLGQVVAKL